MGGGDSTPIMDNILKTAPDASISEQERRAHLLKELAARKVPGRTLPRGMQWTGLDLPGGRACQRRVRQIARQNEETA
jgi:hypothetical protein